jgi:hypothetical protein
MTRRFARVLDRVGRELLLPEPERSLILQEMASDLEDLFEAYRERGMSEGEAVRQAEAALAASTDTLAELIRIHRPLHRRLAERYAERGRHAAEQRLLGLLAAGTLIWVAITQLTGALDHASAFFWAVGAVAAALCVLVPLAGYGMVSRRAEGQRAAPGGRRAILALGLLAVLLGAFGAGLELYTTMGGLATANEWSLYAFALRVGRVADLLATSLAVGLAAGLAWFFLESRALRAARASGVGFLDSISREEA